MTALNPALLPQGLGAEVPRSKVRMVLVRPGRAPTVAPFREFVDQLTAGDVLVLNDAATFPSSLWAITEGGAAVEARLFDGEGTRWRAVLFGRGDWRTKTEDRPAPAQVAVGERLHFGTLNAKVVEVSAISPRLIAIEFESDPATAWRHIFDYGRPIQYAYRPEAEPLWAFQNAYGARPWAAEQPSAGRPLTMELLLEAQKRGVELRMLTEATGLSSTGDAAIDAALPLPERYEIPAETAEAVNRAIAEERRVIAVGTSVMRALEASALADGQVHPGQGSAALVIDETHRPKVVTALLSGVHVPGESHWRLLRSLAAEEELQRAYALAREQRLEAHERGDAALLFAR
ncbi:MAG: S-adenosylmethionine:tRNA ribosyltransferase-isomerase [Myxococcaceae bacterium]